MSTKHRVLEQELRAKPCTDVHDSVTLTLSTLRTFQQTTC